MRAFVAVALALVLAGCGSTSSRSTSGTEASAALTKAAYQAMLKRANARVTKVEGAAEQGLSPGATPAHVKALVLAWAHTERSSGDRLARCGLPRTRRARTHY